MRSKFENMVTFVEIGDGENEQIARAKEYHLDVRDTDINGWTLWKNVQEEADSIDSNLKWMVLAGDLDLGIICV